MTPELWNKANATLAANRIALMSRATKHTYLLIGLIRRQSAAHPHKYSFAGITVKLKNGAVGAARQRIEQEKQFLMRQAKRGRISEDVFEREWQSSNRQDWKLAHEQDEIRQLAADREA